jgi:hypothetical protein
MPAVPPDPDSSVPMHAVASVIETKQRVEYLNIIFFISL